MMCAQRCVLPYARHKNTFRTLYIVKLSHHIPAITIFTFKGCLRHFYILMFYIIYNSLSDYHKSWEISIDTDPQSIRVLLNG
jgi:hypothetical protein